MMVNKIKSELKFSSYIASIDNCTVQIVSSNTVCMNIKGLIHFFRWGLFKDFPGPYFDLYDFIFNQAKWKPCFGHKHVHMQKRQTRRAWKHVHTKHSLFISGSMDMHESSKRAMGIKNECFYTDIFRFCSIKKMKDIQEPKPISTYPFLVYAWNAGYIC